MLKKHWPKFAIAFGLVLAVVAVFVSARLAARGPFPASVVASSNYPLYYPAPLPKGYQLDKKSIRSDHQVLFFNLQNHSRVISISEQEAPSQGLNLQTIQTLNPSLKKTDSAAGQVLQGLDVEKRNPVAIVLSNTTLINLSGTSDVPQDVMAKVVNNLSSLP